MDPVPSVSCEATTQLNNIDALPDTQIVQESTLAFPRIRLWVVARAIARARAVYIRFLYLISELKVLEGVGSAQYKDVLGTERDYVKRW